jgi:hypothetical protein
MDRYEIGKAQRVEVRAAIRALDLPGVTVDEHDHGFIRIASSDQVSIIYMSFGYRDQFTLKPAYHYSAREGAYPLKDEKYNLPGILRTVRRLVEEGHQRNRAATAYLANEERERLNREASTEVLRSAASVYGWTLREDAITGPEVWVEGVTINASQVAPDRLRVCYRRELVTHAKPETVPAFLAALDTFIKSNSV